MATLGEAVSLILADLKRADTSMSAEAQSHLLRAVEYYSTHRFWFNEARASFTASSTIYYPLASFSGISDFREIDTMTVTVNGYRYEIKPETFDRLEFLDTGNVTGIPTKYAFFGETIRLYPKPDSVYQVDVAGQQRLATLSATGNSNALLTHGLDMVIARAEKTIYARRLKNYEAASAMGQLEQEELGRLQEQTEKLSVGGIQPGCD